MENYSISEVHISTIKVADTILCTDGAIRTVCKADINRGFLGITLFGDSYKMGNAPVKKVEFIKVN